MTSINNNIVTSSAIAKVQNLGPQRKDAWTNAVFESTSIKALFDKHITGGQDVTYAEVFDAINTSSLKDLRNVRKTALRFLFEDPTVKQTFDNRVASLEAQL